MAKKRFMEDPVPNSRTSHIPRTLAELETALLEAAKAYIVAVHMNPGYSTSTSDRRLLQTRTEFMNIGAEWHRQEKLKSRGNAR